MMASARKAILEGRAKPKAKSKSPKKNKNKKVAKGKVAHLLSQMETRLVLPTFG
jgi:hypothetical protein